VRIPALFFPVSASSFDLVTKLQLRHRTLGSSSFPNRERRRQGQLVRDRDSGQGLRALALIVVLVKLELRDQKGDVM